MMSATTLWLVAALGLYAAFTIYCGVATARTARGPRSFFLADRDLPAWSFVLTGTAVTVSAWLSLGQIEAVARAGLPAAALAFGAVTAPLSGVLFAKRQWMLARRFGYVTPAEMLGDYYGSELIRVLVLVVALAFAVPFAGMQLAATGRFVADLSGGVVDPVLAMWVLTGVIFASVCIGGLKAVALTGALQALYLGAGVVGAGALMIWQAGGFTAFNTALAQLGSTGGRGFLAVPGVMQFTAGLGVETPAGGTWTALAVGSTCLGLMGLQLMPAFGMLVFAARSPRGFAPQQVWASAGAMGAVLVVFATAAGLGLRLLPAQASGGTALAARVAAGLGTNSPWFVGLLAVAALAAAQVFAALLLSTTATLLVRDGLRRYLRPDLDVVEQRVSARIAMACLALAAVLLATFAPRASVALGAVAIGFGFQLLPALAGVCWLPWVTREGVTVGLVAGLLGVVFTEPLGIGIAGAFGLHLPWGRWPWTIHSAAWGMAVNAAACLVVSLISRHPAEFARRSAVHAFLRDHAGPEPGRPDLRPLAWAAVLAWLFFAIGPGLVLGNGTFGDAGGGFAAWLVGVPSLWAWQMLWWALGVLLLWFLADRLGLSTRISGHILPLPRSRRPASDGAALSSDGARSWLWAALGLGALAVVANWLFG